MKKAYLLASLLLLAPAVTQAQEEGRVESEGGVTIGAQQVDIDPDSSKFTEYRDIDNGFYLYDLWFDLLDTKTGMFMDFKGENLIRDDQSIRTRLGDYGRGWNLGIERNEIPHNLSNKAKTPYINQGNGLYTLPTPVTLPTTNVLGVPTSGYNLAPNQDQANAGLLTNNDAATEDWLTTHLRDTDLGTQRDKTSAILQYSPLAELKFRLSLSDEQKDGSKIGYGPIGDRPPRTLNIQFAEPIEYETQELKFEAEYNQPGWQTLFTYLISDFGNEIDTLRWQNIYARTGADLAANGGDATYDQWTGHRVATFGQRALSPDNRYQNASLTMGIDLPMASRLTATAAYGWMEQDEALLPYSTSNFGTATLGSARALPRANADAEIDTKLLKADYTINPIDRLNLRAFVRYYDLENDTPQNQWWYVTSDGITGNLAGTSGNASSGNTTDANKRVNLAYSYDQMNYGLETSYNLPFWRTILGLGYEREDIDREFREGSTEENIFKGSVRTRPTNWLALSAKYLYGDRDGGTYNGDVATDASYWGVDPTDTHNPVNAFGNHPDMRRFDVSDRERDQLDLAATIMPTETMDLTASYRYRNDDYDSGVTPVQPILGTGVADENLFTAGDQLGLLETETQRYALDGVYAATDRLTLNAFGSRETIESTQRGMEFNENNKLDPSTQAGKDLGGWDASFADQSQWMAITDDKTNTIGFGAGYEIIPGKLRLSTDYAISKGKVDITYSGLGSVATDNVLPASLPSTLPLSTDQYAFSTPPTVTHNQYNLNASLEYQVMENVVLGLHYMFDRYKISDWMQESDTPWFESVNGSEYLLRDTSDATSTQWGNRLVNLGSYLGPSYESHLAAVTMTYRF